MRIIGIDPGLRTLGWGVIEADGPRLRHVANGLCQTGSGALADRLLELFDQLTTVIARERPDAAAIEQTFVNRDGAGTLKLGQARGVAVLVPARAGVPVAEYAPNQVKKTVVGVGHADKRQVAHMVAMQLPGARWEKHDAADALAIAICHAHHAQSATRLATALAVASAGGDQAGGTARAACESAAGAGSPVADRGGVASEGCGSGNGSGAAVRGSPSGAGSASAAGGSRGGVHGWRPATGRRRGLRE